MLGLLENTGKLIGPTDKHVHVFRVCTAIIRFVWTVLAIGHVYACGGSRKYRAMFETRVHFDKADSFIRNLASNSQLSKIWKTLCSLGKYRFISMPRVIKKYR